MRGKPVSISPVSQRWQRAVSELEGTAQDAGRTRHGFRAYSAILDQVSPLRRGLQIPKVNYMVNRLLAYREDSFLYKKAEYWASPVETLTRRAGDCEDYAILKYALFRDLGVKDEDMRIVVLRDTAARQYHAVLSVRHNGKWLILDNRFSRVRFERDLPHYQALYSVNAAGEWSHMPNAGKPVNLAARLKSATR
ncbi:transglutaminase-like cysteine peptidase [uncultured Roseibium sp.]|uniref:transglutaminase-like cysteine peptidase n=1 Tax=uncultured Roseibium sp. TaxID=1936171 RepID=UPI0026104C2E|nr:transglutaminase-like cysteine peptidase [uncultured Roseibium sp.]